MDFSPECYLFWVSVTLTGLVRIPKMRYGWKDLSFKLLLFINARTKGTCVYSLSQVKFKFLGDKKWPMKGFYLEVCKIDSVFLYQVYLLNYDNCFYIHCMWRFVLILRASHATVKLKRDWNMILNSRCELFLKTGMFLRAVQKFSQNVQKKIKKA